MAIIGGQMITKVGQQLEGYRTHVANWARAAAGVGMALGYVIDPNAVITLYDEFVAWWLAGEIIMAAAISFFRSLGNQREEHLKVAMRSKKK